MKLITTVVRPERLPQVKAALFRAGVTGVTISRVSGHGGERELHEHYRGANVVLEFREKVRLEMAVSDGCGHGGDGGRGATPGAAAIGAAYAEGVARYGTASFTMS